MYIHNSFLHGFMIYLLFIAYASSTPRFSTNQPIQGVPLDFGYPSQKKQRKQMRQQSQQGTQQSSIDIQLQDFGSRNNDQFLINAFGQFLIQSGLHEFFFAVSQHPLLGQLLDGIDIKIDRQNATFRFGVSQNNYTCSLVQHDFGLVGSNASNHSRSIGDKVILERDKLGLLEQLDKESWISKIILHFDPHQNVWIVQKFGAQHAVYRGLTRSGKVAAVALALH